MVLLDSKCGGVENHCKEVLTDLSRLCWEEHHCDLTFICTADGTEIHAHVYLLSKVSIIIKQAANQFYQQHHGHMHVTLDGIDSPTLGTLIEFLYLGGTTMSHKAADNLYVLCEMLAIDIDQSKITVTGETTRVLPRPQMINSERVKNTPVVTSTKKPSSSSPKLTPVSLKNSKLSKSVPKYCYCKQPSSKDLLGCDFCPEWYHPRCLKISQAEARKLVKQDSWKCPECVKKLNPGLHKKKGKLMSQDGKIEQLDGENSFRLTPIKTELLSDDEWSSNNKAFSVNLQPLEKWGEKQGLVQMDKETYRVWHNTETPTPSPPPSPRSRSLESKKNLSNGEKNDIPVTKKSNENTKMTLNNGPNDSEKDYGKMMNNDTKTDNPASKDSKEDLRKMLLNRSRSRPRPVKREKPSFESTLGEIAAKEEEEVKEKRARMSMTSVHIKGQISEMKGKKNEREQSSGHHTSSTLKSVDTKKEKLDESTKSTQGKKKERTANKKAVSEKDADINWEFNSETEEVNRPVEDAKQTSEKGTPPNSGDTGSDGGNYDELFFCYICKSIYVTKGALDNHHKTAH